MSSGLAHRRRNKDIRNATRHAAHERKVRFWRPGRGRGSQRKCRAQSAIVSAHYYLAVHTRTATPPNFSLNRLRPSERVPRWHALRSECCTMRPPRRARGWRGVGLCGRTMLRPRGSRPQTRYLRRPRRPRDSGERRATKSFGEMLHARQWQQEAAPTRCCCRHSPAMTTHQQRHCCYRCRHRSPLAQMKVRHTRCCCAMSCPRQGAQAAALAALGGAGHE